MNNCTIICPKLPDLMVAQAYLGYPVTYEDVICGQIGLKHCKVWPGQKKVELLRVNTNVTGKRIWNLHCLWSFVTSFQENVCLSTTILQETINAEEPKSPSSPTLIPASRTS